MALVMGRKLAMNKINKKYLWFLAIFIFLAILFYVFFGYGKYKFDNKAENYSVFIDNNYAGDNLSEIKARPGKHKVIISSPSFEINSSLSVKLFSTKKVNVNSQKRDFAKTIADLLSEQQVKLQDGSLQDSWYTALVTDSDGVNLLALRFKSGGWQIEYRGDGLDDNFKILPNDIRQRLINTTKGKFND